MFCYCTQFSSQVTLCDQQWSKPAFIRFCFNRTWQFLLFFVTFMIEETFGMINHLLILSLFMSHHPVSGSNIGDKNHNNNQRIFIFGEILNLSRRSLNAFACWSDSVTSVGHYEIITWFLVTAMLVMVFISIEKYEGVNWLSHGHYCLDKRFCKNTGFYQQQLFTQHNKGRIVEFNAKWTTISTELRYRLRT